MYCSTLCGCCAFARLMASSRADLPTVRLVLKKTAGVSRLMAGEKAWRS
jgi:hypothetical protein